MFVFAAIETCRRELSGTTTEYMHGQSECSEQTSSDAPVLEEFIPLKRTSSEDDNDEQHSHDPADSNSMDKIKSDWLRSVQLWNQSPDPPSKEVPTNILFYFPCLVAKKQSSKVIFFSLLVGCA